MVDMGLQPDSDSRLGEQDPGIRPEVELHLPPDLAGLVLRYIGYKAEVLTSKAGFLFSETSPPAFIYLCRVRPSSAAPRSVLALWRGARLALCWHHGFTMVLGVSLQGATSMMSFVTFCRTNDGFVKVIPCTETVDVCPGRHKGMDTFLTLDLGEPGVAKYFVNHNLVWETKGVHPALLASASNAGGSFSLV